jgi:hypothetical protein
MHKQRSIFIGNVNLAEDSLFTEEISRVLICIDFYTGRRNRPSDNVVRKRRLAARYLIEGMYQGFCHIDKLPLSVPHHPSTYSKKSSNLHNLGYEIIRSVCDTLEAMQWVKRSMGYQSSSGSENITTTLKPIGALQQRFSDLGIRWQAMEPLESVIELRNYDAQTKRKYRIPIPEEVDATRIAHNLKRINQFLNQQAIALCVKDFTLREIAQRMAVGQRKRRYTYVKEMNYPLTFTFDQVQLKRVFSRSSMQQGGRFYGGWWQFIPRQHRINITINGLATVEIDYSGLHPSMLYHLEGLSPPAGDLYDIGLWSNETEKEKMRKLIKEFFNASINDQYGEFRLTQSEMNILGTTNPKLLARIKERHAPIAKYLASGFGLTLQYIDSQIAERVMLLLLEQDIVCLPVHDSFIGPLHQRAIIEEVMAKAYQERFGFPIPTAQEDLFMNDENNKPKHERQFEGRLNQQGKINLEDLVKEMDSVHSRYVHSYWSVKRQG